MVRGQIRQRLSLLKVCCGSSALILPPAVLRCARRFPLRAACLGKVFCAPSARDCKTLYFQGQPSACQRVRVAQRGHPDTPRAFGFKVLGLFWVGAASVFSLSCLAALRSRCMRRSTSAAALLGFGCAARVCARGLADFFARNLWFFFVQRGVCLFSFMPRSASLAMLEAFDLCRRAFRFLVRVGRMGPLARWLWGAQGCRLIPTRSATDFIHNLCRCQNIANSSPAGPSTALPGGQAKRQRGQRGTAHVSKRPDYCKFISLIPVQWPALPSECYEPSSLHVHGFPRGVF